MEPGCVPAYESVQVENATCPQASGKGTGTQLWLLFPAKSVAEPRLLLAKNVAFAALPRAPNKPFDVTEKQSSFSPSASVGVTGFHTEWPQGSSQP